MTEFIDKTDEGKEKCNPTKFIYFISVSNLKLEESNSQPKDFDEVTLMKKKNMEHNYDLIIAKNSIGAELWYLGHWNDGC